MTGYYRLIDDVNTPGRWFLRGPVDPQGEPVDPRVFTDGRPFSGTAELFLPLRQPGRPLDFTFADADMPVVRQGIGQLLERLAPGDVQRIPTVVEGESDQFEILNITKSLDTIDSERSEITYWREVDGRSEKVGKPRMVLGLRIAPSRVGKAQVFRVRDWEIALIVSDAIRRALTEVETTGVQFDEV